MAETSRPLELHPAPRPHLQPPLTTRTRYGAPLVKFVNKVTGAIIFTADLDAYYAKHQDWEAKPFDIGGRP